jgi:hypothetical protein
MVINEDGGYLLLDFNWDMVNDCCFVVLLMVVSPSG